MLDARREMNYIEKHFKLNRILLLAIGLWPYGRSKLARLQLILFFSILTSFIIFQLTALWTAECNPDLVIKIFSSLLIFIACAIKYNSFWINNQTIQNLWEQLKHICNELKDENEIGVMQKYGSNSERYTARIILLTIISVFIIIFLPIYPRVFDTLLTNKSEAYRGLQIVTEYFIDQEKYFYLILLHMNAAVCIGATAMIATGTMLIVYLKHACGMFKIASYRIEQAMMISVLQNIGLGNELLIYKGLIYAVDIHCKAMEFSEILISAFEGSFFFLIVVGVVCLSLNLFGVFKITVYGGDNMELSLHFTIVTICLVYTFLANCAAQDITDHNNHVFKTVYNVQWYMAPLHIQKMILFLLQRSTKPFNLSLGGLFVGSIESAATLMSTSISYFTVLYSTQQ